MGLFDTIMGNASETSASDVQEELTPILAANETVAEFVVDNATAEVLRDLKVDFGQGFALDKPKPLAHRVQWRVKLASA